MPTVINGEIVVISQVATEPFGGFVYESHGGSVWLHRASLNKANRVQFLVADNVIIPDAKVNYVEKLTPHSRSTVIPGSRQDFAANEENSDRIKLWLESKGVNLS